jgi:hypothetical protein
MQVGTSTIRAVPNVVHGCVKFLPKPRSSNWASIRIPIMGSFGFIACRGMKDDFHDGHPAFR